MQVGEKEEPLDNRELISKEKTVAEEEPKLSKETILELLRVANKSNSPKMALQKVVNMILKIANKYSASDLPIEILGKLIDQLEYSFPFELLTILSRLSCVNRHYRELIKPFIVSTVCEEFNLSEDLVKGFLKLVCGRSGMPCEYLSDLLINKDRQNKIKKLKKSIRANLDQSIKNLEAAVGIEDYDEAMDLIMALPEKMCCCNVGNLLKLLIAKSQKDILRMLISSGISINELMIEPTFIESCSLFFNKAFSLKDPYEFIPKKMNALNFAIIFRYHDMAKFLIDENIDINAIDYLGFSALDYAIQHGYSKIRKMLILRGAEEGPKAVGPWSMQSYSDLKILTKDLKRLNS